MNVAVNTDLIWFNQGRIRLVPRHLSIGYQSWRTLDMSSDPRTTLVAQNLLAWHSKPCQYYALFSPNTGDEQYRFTQRPNMPYIMAKGWHVILSCFYRYCNSSIDFNQLVGLSSQMKWPRPKTMCTSTNILLLQQKSDKGIDWWIPLGSN